MRDAIFRLTARGRREISTIGWVVIFLTVFFITAGTVFGINWLNTRNIRPLATASPFTISPQDVEWTLEKEVLPGGTEVYSAPQDVKLRAASAFVDAWNALAFLDGLPVEAEEQKIFDQYFWPNSPAYEGAVEIIKAARQTGTYWRREIVGQVSMSNVIDFSQSGVEAKFSLGFPAESVKNELVDIRSGQVITSKNIDLVYSVTVRYDTGNKRWKVYQVDLPR